MSYKDFVFGYEDDISSTFGAHAELNSIFEDPTNMQYEELCSLFEDPTNMQYEELYSLFEDPTNM